MDRTFITSQLFAETEHLCIPSVQIFRMMLVLAPLLLLASYLGSGGEKLLLLELLLKMSSQLLQPKAKGGHRDMSK